MKYEILIPITLLISVLLFGWLFVDFSNVAQESVRQMNEPFAPFVIVGVFLVIVFYSKITAKTGNSEEGK